MKGMHSVNAFVTSKQMDIIAKQLRKFIVSEELGLIIVKLPGQVTIYFFDRTERRPRGE